MELSSFKVSESFLILQGTTSSSSEPQFLTPETSSITIGFYASCFVAQLFFCKKFEASGMYLHRISFFLSAWDGKQFN